MTDNRKNGNVSNNGYGSEDNITSDVAIIEDVQLKLSTYLSSIKREENRSKVFNNMFNIMKGNIKKGESIENNLSHMKTMLNRRFSAHPDELTKINDIITPIEEIVKNSKTSAGGGKLKKRKRKQSAGGKPRRSSRRRSSRRRRVLISRKSHRRRRTSRRRQ